MSEDRWALSLIDDFADIVAFPLGSLKALEARHAKLRSDEDGDYYEIPAFQEGKAAWVDGIERELSSIFGDDRATVISPIIARKDNDKQTGLYFRKVRSITRSESILIEETVFEEGSGMIDKDYSVYQSPNESRWEHLFTPKNEPPAG